MVQMGYSIFYNSWMPEHKTPFGAVHYQDTVNLSLFVGDESAEAVFLRIHKDYGGFREIEMQPRPSSPYYEVEIDFNEGPGLYFYSFRIQRSDQSYYYGNNQQGFGGPGQLYYNESQVYTYQLTTYKEEDYAPDWYLDGIAYQIFVDRFDNGNEDGSIDNPKPNSVIYTQDSPVPYYIKNEQGEIVHWDFYGGNLKGVIKHIPYFKEMGVSILYLNPIFEARSNHKYDTGDYYKIDPMFGDEAIFDELIEACRQAGIRIILDGVFNHTGADSLYFNRFRNYNAVGAYQSQESPYFDWFYFIDFPKDYDSWWGVKDLPRLNTENPAVRDFFFGHEDSVIQYWTKKGIGGWRIDVADEMSDDFLKGIRQGMDSCQGDHVMIGEVWEDATNKISYDQRREYINGGIMHGAMNYPVRDIIIQLLNNQLTVQEAARRVLNLKENYPRAAFYSNLNNLGSHDTVRIKSALRKNMDKLRLAYIMMFMTPGVPTIYYGDEVGLTGGEDPDNRRPFPWGKEDSKLQAFVQNLAHYRRDHSELVDGELLPFAAGRLLGILRYNDQDEWSLAIFNPTNRIHEFRLEEIEDLTNFDLAKYLHDRQIRNEMIGSNSFRIYNSKQEKISSFDEKSETD